MTDGRDQSAVRRPVVVTAVLLVVVAVLLVALRSWLDRPVVEEIVATPVAEPEQPATVPEAEPDIEQTESPAPTQVGVVTLLPAVAPPERVKVALLPARLETNDPVAEALLSTVRQATLRGLLGMANIDVIDVNASELTAFAPTNAGSLREDRLLFLAVRGRYESDLVAEIYEQSTPDSRSWSIGVHVIRPTGQGGGTRSFSKDGAYRPGGDPESIGMEFAQRIARDTGRVSDANPAAADARNILLDPTRSEQERMRAISNLGGTGLDSETIAAAVDMATRSPTASTRQMVWSLLRRGVYDPALAQPLSYSLLSDLDAVVRKEAALALGAYLNTPGSRAALANAATIDSSSDVRIAARMAMMDYDEQQAFKRATLLDPRLTPAERLAPSTMIEPSRMMNFFVAPGPAEQEEALAYAEIISATDDPDLKFRALGALQNVTLMMPTRGNVAPEIIRVLIESSEVADDRVRRSALNALRLGAQNPEVRAALEAVIENEPALAAELRLAEAIEEAASRPFTSPPPPNRPPGSAMNFEFSSGR